MKESKMAVTEPILTPTSCLIRITPEIIADSVRSDSGHCMISEAIRLVRPTATGIAVDLQTIRFSDPKKRCRYTFLTPRRAQEALVAFDQGDKVIEPFSFRLERGQVSEMGGRWSKKKPRRAVLKNTEREKVRHNVPNIVGGQTPPISALRRRQFGLRALKR
jgi:hypothetical protein